MDAAAELGRNPVSRHQIQPEYGDGQADAGRETAEPISRDQILKRERGQGNIIFPCSADHEQDWQPYPVDPYSCYVCDHTYVSVTIHWEAQMLRLERTLSFVYRVQGYFPSRRAVMLATVVVVIVKRAVKTNLNDISAYEYSSVLLLHSGHLSNIGGVLSAISLHVTSTVFYRVVPPYSKNCEIMW